MENIDLSKNKNLCPEFPFWGASYPDACCVNGKLQDLDYCDENGNLMIRVKMFLARSARQRSL